MGLEELFKETVSTETYASLGDTGIEGLLKETATKKAASKPVSTVPQDWKAYLDKKNSGLTTMQWWEQATARKRNADKIVDDLQRDVDALKKGGQAKTSGRLAGEVWDKNKFDTDLAELNKQLRAALEEQSAADADLGFAKKYKQMDWYDSQIASGKSWQDIYDTIGGEYQRIYDEYQKAYDELAYAKQRNNYNAAEGAEAYMSDEDYAALEEKVNMLAKMRDNAAERRSIAQYEFATGDESLMQRGEQRNKALVEMSQTEYVNNLREVIANGMDATTMAGANIDILMKDQTPFMPSAEWSEEQLKVYYGLLGNGREEEARQYAVDTNSDINRRNRSDKLSATEEWGYEEGKPNLSRVLAGTAASVATAPESIVKWLDKVQHVKAQGVYVGSDDMWLSDYAGAITRGVSKGLNEQMSFGEKGLGDLYQVGNSMVQSIVYGGGLSKLLGAGLAKGAATMAEAGTLATFFGTAANEAFDDAIERGATAEQAVTISVLSGAAEVLGEKMSLDGLLKMNKSAAKGLAYNILKQAGIEGGEEVATDMMNMLADRFVMGNKSKVIQGIQQRMANGESYDDALAAEWKQYAKDVAWSFMAGALSGGVSSSVFYGMDAISPYAADEQGNYRYGADAQTLVDEAKQIKKPDNIQVKNAQKKLDKGKHITNHAAKQLTTTTNRGRMVDAVETQINERATEIDEKTARSLANAVVAKSRGEKLTTNQEKLISKNEKIASELAQEIDPKNPAEWAQRVGMRGEEAAVYGDRNVINEFEQIEQDILNAGEYAEARNQLKEKDQDAEQYTEDFDKMAEVFGNTKNYDSFEAAWDAAQKQGTTLTETQAKAAWEAGQTKLNTAKTTPTMTRKGTGAVSFEAVQDGDTHYEAPNEDEIRVFKNSARYQYLEELAKQVKVDIVFYKAGATGINGKYVNGTVYLAVDASPTKYNSVEGYVMMTAAHELTHYIKEASPARFAELKDFVTKHLIDTGKMEGMTLNELIDAKRAAYKEAGVTLNVESAIEEIVADACEMMLKDNMLVAQLKGENKTLHGMVSNWMKKFLKNVKGAFKSVTGTQLEAYHTEAKAMEDVFNELQQIWNAGLTEAAQMEIGSIDLSETAAATNVDGQPLLQIKAMEADMDTYRTMLTDYGKMSKAEIDTLFDTINEALDVINDNLEALDYAWEEDIDDRAYNPVKPNSDKLYKVSIDFSTLCRKRIMQQVVASKLQEELNRAITREEGIAIRNALLAIQAEGKQIEVACALCYVESARMKSPKQIQKFIDDVDGRLKDFFATKDKETMKAKQREAEMAVRKKHGIEANVTLKQMDSKIAAEIRQAKRDARSEYKLTAEEQRLLEAAKSLKITDFTTPAGLANLKKTYPRIYDAYTSFVRNATKSKAIEGDTWWRAGDSQSIGDSLIEAMNNENGTRSQSWSDFQVIHMMDYVAATIELSTRGAKEQAYTKVPDFVDLMGKTGAMINLSLIPTREYNGTLEYDSVEGMPYDVALRLRDKYPNTAGTICIGINDGQIRQLLADKNIDYVIPYHKSGMEANTRKLMGIPNWDQFESFQNESKLDRRAAEVQAAKYGVQLLAENDSNYHKAPNFSDWFDLSKAQTTAKANASTDVLAGGYAAMQEAAENYLKMCAERGLSPKFSKGMGDFTMEENYWKLLIDRKMVNHITGEVIEQQAIQPIFDRNEVLRILNDEVNRYEQVQKDQDYALDKVTKAFMEGKVKPGMSVEQLADAMQTPVDNVTEVNILASARDMSGGKASIKSKGSVTFNNGKNTNGVFAHNELIDLVSRKNESWTGRVLRDIYNMDAREFEEFLTKIGELSGNMPYYENSDAEEVPECFIVYDNNGNVFRYDIELDGYMHGEVLAKTEVSRKIAVIKKEAGDNAESLSSADGSIESAWIERGRSNRNNDAAGREGRLAAYGRMGEGSSRGTEARTSERVSQSSQSENAVSGKLSIKDEAMSDRMLLANTLMTAAQNDGERRRLNNYKSQMDKFEDIQQQLDEAEIELSRVMRVGNQKDIEIARRERDGLLQQLIRADKKLLELQATKPLKELMERVKEDTRSTTEQRGRERLETVKERETKKRKDAVNKVRNQKNERIAEIRQEEKQKRQEAVAKERQKANQRVAQERSYYQGMIKRGAENRSKTAIRTKIKNLHAQMTTQLLNPKENRYVPKPLLKNVAELLDEINLDTGRSEKVKTKLAELSAAYKAVAQNNEYGYVFDPVVADMIDQLQQTMLGMDDTSIYNMSKDQLEQLYNTMKAVNHTVRNAVKLVKYETEKNIFQISKSLMEETGRANPVANKLANKYINASLRPETFFKRMGGYSKNSAWQMMYDMLNEAQRKQTQIQMESAAIFEDLMKDTKAFDKMTDPKNLIDIGLEDENGKPVNVTPDIAIKIYLDTMAQDNARHLMAGGYTIPNMREYYKGKPGEAYGRGSVTIHGFGPTFSELQHNLRHAETEQEKAEIQEKIAQAEEDAAAWVDELRQNIFDQLGEYEIEWIKAAEKFFNNYSQKVLNETTMAVYGFEKATVPYYVPIHTDSAYRQANFESISRDMSLENMGFMKARVEGAKNPMLAEGIVDVVNGQISSVSKYAAMMPAVRNFQKVYGKSTASFENSVQSAVRSKFGTEALKYIENVVTDLTSPRRTEGGMLGEYADILRGNLAQAALTINPRVALGQAASYPTAAAEIGWQPLAKAFKEVGNNPMWNESAREEIAEWSPLLWLRMQGYFDRDIGDMRSSKSTMNKVNEKLKFMTGWIEFMDGLTVGKLWYAAQYYVEDTVGMERGTEEFMKETAKVFNRIVERTQPNYTVLQRSDIQRNPNAIVKQLTMFMTQRLQNTNILLDAVGTYNSYVKDYKNGRNDVDELDVKEAKQQLNRAVSSQLAAAATITAFKLLADALTYSMKAYRDDDDELTAASVANQYVENFFESLASNFLWGSELNSIVKSIATGDTYYGISLSGVDTFTDALSAMVKTAQDPSKENLLKATKNAAQMMGIPANNITKLYNAVAHRIKDAAEGNGFWDFESEIKMTDERRARKMYEAAIAGDEKALAKFFDYYKTEKDADAALASHIKQKFEAGELDADEAIEQLTEIVGMSNHDAEAAINKLSGEIETGIAYDDLKDAYLNEQLTDAEAIDYRVKYGGQDRDDAEAAVSKWKCELETGYVYDDLQEYLAAEDITKQQAIDYRMKYGGQSLEDATVMVTKWMGEIETGIPYDKVEQYYRAGKITHEELANYYMKYWSYDEEKAIKVADKIEFVGEDSRLEDATLAAVSGYVAYCEDAAVDKFTYLTAYQTCYDIRADKDKNGKSISGSALKKKLAYINGLKLKPYQKTAVAKAIGITDKQLDKYDAAWL